MDIDILNDTDDVVNSINKQTETALNYRADNINYIPETSNIYNVESNSMDTVIEHGENVVVKNQSFFDTLDFVGDEIGRVAIGGLGYVGDKLIGLIDNVDELYEGPTEKYFAKTFGYDSGSSVGTFQDAVGKMKLPTADLTVNEWYKDNFEPKTEIGKIIQPIAAEIEGFVLSNLILKKAGLNLPAAGSNQWKKWGVDILRWATAEASVGFTMAEDQPSAMLMIGDLLGITDENALPAIRKTYQELLDTKTPENEFQLRMMNTVDRFALGAASEVLVKFLFKVYKPMIAAGLTSTITFDNALNNKIKQNIENLGF